MYIYIYTFLTIIYSSIRGIQKFDIEFLPENLLFLNH